MKFKFWLLVLVICLNLAGCVVPRYEKNSYSGTWSLLDIDALGTEKTGHIAVTDGENLYYFTDEYDKAGIYQMSLDGGAEMLLAEEKEIGQIQLAEGKLFYSSFAQIYYGDKEKGDARGNKSYSLKSLNLSTGEVYVFDCDSVLASELEKYPNEVIDPNRGLVNFHYCGDNVFLASTVETTVPTRRFQMFTGFIAENKFTRVEELFELRDFSEELEHASCRVYFNDNVMVISPVSHQTLQDMLCTTELYIYDKQGDYGYRSAGATYSGMLKLDYPDQTISMINDTRALVTAKNRIILCEPESGEVIDRIEVPTAKGLMYVKSVSIVIAYETDGKTQSLYRLDTDDFSIEKIAAFENENIIGITGDYVVTAADRVLKKYTLQDNQVVQEWEKTYSESFDQLDIAIEVCADWLFVKKFDGEKSTLLYKEKLNDH